MAVVSNGAALVKALKDSGTPNWRLAAARECLARVHESESRVASAEEVIAVLRQQLGEDNGTVRKARCLMETGECAAPKHDAVPVEEALLVAPPKADPKKPGKVEKPAV